MKRGAEFGIEYFQNIGKGQAGVISFTEKGDPINGSMRSRRKELGLKQEDLAKRIGISGPYISHIEELLRMPHPKLAKKIAAELGAEVEELFPKYLEEFVVPRPYAKEKEGIVELCESDVNSEELESAFQLEQDRLPYSQMSDPVQAAELKDLQYQIANMGSTLRPDRKKALWLQMSLEDGKEHTLSEIAQKFGLKAKGSIAQKIGSALRGLRHPVRAKYLMDYAKQDEVVGTTADSPEALLNGAINALYQGDLERAEVNACEVENFYLNRLDFTDLRLVKDILNGVEEPVDISPKVQEAIKNLEPVWQIKRQIIK